MNRPILPLISACLFCAGECLPAVAEIRCELRTADTVLQFEAGASAPRLVTAGAPHLPPISNRAAEGLVQSVEASGKTVPLHWRLSAAPTCGDPTIVSFVYENASPHLRLTWEWRARAAFGPVEHQIRIENLETSELWLPLEDSFQFDFAVAPTTALEHLYVEKGADTPSPIGTHRISVGNGYQWTGTSSTYAHPKPSEAREIIPWFLVEETAGGNRGWYVGLEFSGRTRLTLARSGESVKGAAGLNPDPGPFRTRVPPHESFETPIAFVGVAQGGPDAVGNILRPWVRQVLGNPDAWKMPDYPLTVNNTWGGGMAVNEENAQAMMRDAAKLGLEMAHVDAGWFRGVGDWYADPQKFPHGMAALADYAHKLGLRFGLWVDWTQAALDTPPGALNARDPQVRDWMVTDLPADWKPEPFKGQTIDLGVPAAKQWAQREVERIVSDYHLDMLEHDGYLVAQGCDRDDHPHAPPDNWKKCVYKAWGSYWVESSNSTDVSYHAVHAYYDIYSQLRKDHPGLLLEACNDGGRMVDYGTAAHVDYFSITDTYDPLSNRRAFYDASFALPPAMLESYVEKWATPRIENFRYMLRSGMMGWLTVMIDTNTWTEEQHRVAAEEIRLYKGRLRPLIRDADLYHISARPDGVRWDGIEYFDPSSGRGVVFAFRGATQNESKHVFFLQGFRPEAPYRVHFQDGSSSDRVASGRELMRNGVTITLAKPNSSELVLFETVNSTRSRLP
jgi:alpha-galactosidase